MTLPPIKATKYLKKFYWKDYAIISLGLIIYSVGLICFIKPGGIVTGGLAGVALLVDYSTRGAIPMQYVYFSVNCLLLALSMKILGVKFLIKTIYGVVTLTALLTVLQMFAREPLFLTIIDKFKNEPLLSGLIGGMMCGGGIGMVFSVNGSTGGTDIVIAVINKYKNMSFGRIMMLIDIFIIGSSYFVNPNNASVIVAGMIVLAVMTYTIDLVINGFRQSVQFLIFSEHYEEIANAINGELHRGCTVLDGMGWYSKKPCKVIIVLAKRSEAVSIFRLIRQIDPHAFISQSNARGVYGKGFDAIRD